MKLRCGFDKEVGVLDINGIVLYSVKRSGEKARYRQHCATVITNPTYNVETERISEQLHLPDAIRDRISNL